jgi:hypothetical protein
MGENGTAADPDWKGAAFHPEDGGSTDLWNVTVLPQHCTASQPRRPRLG